MRLDEARESGVEARRQLPELLEHDPVGLEDWRGRGVAKAERRAIDVQDAGVRIDFAVLQEDPVALDAADVTEPDHVSKGQATGTGPDDNEIRSVSTSTDSSAGR